MTKVYDLYHNFLYKSQQVYNFAWIRRLKVHPGVVLLIWKLAWEWLPCKAILSCHDFHISSFYDIFLEVEESFILRYTLCMGVCL